MSALYRMAFSTHKQVEVGYGDRIIISASAIPGNENSVSTVVNELFRKGCDVIYGNSWHLHVSRPCLPGGVEDYPCPDCA